MRYRAYPSEVSDDEWTFVVSLLTLRNERALQREYSLRQVSIGIRCVVRTRHGVSRFRRLVRVYLRLAARWGWLDAGQYRHVSLMTAEVGKLLGGWKRVTRIA